MHIVKPCLWLELLGLLLYTIKLDSIASKLLIRVIAHCQPQSFFELLPSCDILISVLNFAAALLAACNGVALCSCTCNTISCSLLISLASDKSKSSLMFLLTQLRVHAKNFWPAACYSFRGITSLPASLQSVMCCADDAAKDSVVKKGKPPLNIAFACLLLLVECNMHSLVFFVFCAIFQIQMVTITLCFH